INNVERRLPGSKDWGICSFLRPMDFDPIARMEFQAGLGCFAVDLYISLADPFLHSRAARCGKPAQQIDVQTRSAFFGCDGKNFGRSQNALSEKRFLAESDDCPAPGPAPASDDLC